MLRTDIKEIFGWIKKDLEEMKGNIKEGNMEDVEQQCEVIEGEIENLESQVNKVFKTIDVI